jgi:hypothetical protein
VNIDGIVRRRRLVVELSRLLDSMSPPEPVWKLLDAALDSSDDVDLLLDSRAISEG